MLRKWSSKHALMRCLSCTITSSLMMKVKRSLQPKEPLKNNKQMRLMAPNFYYQKSESLVKPAR